jgi:hypothetical protein
MSDKYEAWFVDVATNENRLDDTPIWAETKDEAIAKDDEWAHKVCQQVGEGLLILKRPGEPGSVYSKRFVLLNP